MDMLLSMDIRTMLLLLFWGNLTSLLLIRAYQLLSVGASDHQLVGSLVKAKIFEIIAYFCLALRGALPDLLSVNLGNNMPLFRLLYGGCRHISDTAKGGFPKCQADKGDSSGLSLFFQPAGINV